MVKTKLQEIWEDPANEILKTEISNLSDEQLMIKMASFKKNVNIPLRDNWTRENVRKLCMKIMIETKDFELKILEEEKMEIDEENVQTNKKRKYMY